MMSNNLLLEGANIWDVYEKYYKNTLDEKTYEEIAKCDPTSKGDNKGKYLQWLIKEFVSNGNNDLRKFCLIARESLAWYDRHRQLLWDDKQKDISKLDIFALEKIYEEQKDDLFTQKEIKEQADCVFNSPEWQIIIPKTWAASKYYGAETKWCTASRDCSDYFDSYTSDGPLYINIDKRNGVDKYQFHFESNSFFDEEDNNLLEGYVEVGDSVADYLDIPEDVLAFYESVGHKEDLVKPYEGNWDEYEIWNGETVIGYLMHGTLYDEDRNEISDGYGYDYEVGKFFLIVNREGNTRADLYELGMYGLGDAKLSEENIRFINKVSDYDGKLYVFIDNDSYFAAVDLDNGEGGVFYSSVSGVYSYKELYESIYLLFLNNGQCAIASLYSSEMIIAKKVDYDEFFPEIDNEDCEYLLYQDYDGIRHKVNIYDGEEVEIEEESYSMAESKEKEVIIENFNRILNKIQNIDIRNAPTLF